MITKVKDHKHIPTNIPDHNPISINCGVNFEELTPWTPNID